MDLLQENRLISQQASTKRGLHADSLPRPYRAFSRPDPRKLGAVQQLLSLYLQNRTESTQSTYKAALKNFGNFAGEPVEMAIAYLLNANRMTAHELVGRYIGWLSEEGYSSNTLHLRLAVLKGLVKSAQRNGLCHWQLDELRTPFKKPMPVRETHGPSADILERLFRKIREDRTERGARDRLIVSLMLFLGLRRHEVCAIDYEDLDLTSQMIAVRCKGREGAENFNIEASLIPVFADYLKYRGTKPGPLIRSHSHKPSKTPGRLTGNGLWRIIQKRGIEAGLPNLRCHALRHSGVNIGLDESNGDTRSLTDWARHSNERSMHHYIANQRREKALRFSAGILRRVKP